MASHIYVKDLIDVLPFDVRDLVEMLNAAIRHRDIDRAKVVNGRFEEVSDRLGLRDVGLDADGADTKAAAFSDNCFGRLRRRVVVDYHICAVRSKACQNSGTNAFTGAGDGFIRTMSHYRADIVMLTESDFASEALDLACHHLVMMILLTLVINEDCYVLVA